MQLILNFNKIMVVASKSLQNPLFFYLGFNFILIISWVDRKIGRMNLKTFEASEQYFYSCLELF